MILDLFKLGFTHTTQSLILKTAFARHSLAPSHVCLLTLERDEGYVGPARNRGHGIELRELGQRNVH